MGIKKKHLYAREKTHGRLWCLSGWLLFHQNIMLYAEKQTNRYSSVLWLLQMFSDSYFSFFQFSGFKRMDKPALAMKIFSGTVAYGCRLFSMPFSVSTNRPEEL